MSGIGSVAGAAQAGAPVPQDKVQATQKAEGKAAADQVEETGKDAPGPNQDPSRGQAVDLLG
jgi:hypothetical protein